MLTDARGLNAVSAPTDPFREGVYSMYEQSIETAIKTVLQETRENGGSTVSVIGEKLPEAGYMVGGSVDGFHVDVFTTDNDISAMLETYIHRNYALLTRGNVFLGGWLDKETDELWFDVSDKYNVKEYALMIAADRGELAIWDIASSEEIRVKE